MKHVEEREVTRPERNYKYTCSRCGEPSGDSEDSDARDHYDVSRVEIEMKSGRKIELRIDPPGLAQIHELKSIKIESHEGSSYPEGSHITATVIDCCRKCFEEHALPALVNAGFVPRDEDRSW